MHTAMTDILPPRDFMSKAVRLRKERMYIGKKVLKILGLGSLIIFSFSITPG